MPIYRKATEAGVFDPTEVALLGRVFEETVVPGEDERAREARASRIIGYYQAGVRDEAELRALAKQPLGR
jgi:hypothetical protein